MWLQYRSDECWGILFAVSDRSTVTGIILKLFLFDGTVCQKNTLKKQVHKNVNMNNVRNSRIYICPVGWIVWNKTFYV